MQWVKTDPPRQQLCVGWSDGGETGGLPGFPASPSRLKLLSEQTSDCSKGLILHLGCELQVLVLRLPLGKCQSQGNLLRAPVVSEHDSAPLLQEQMATRGGQVKEQTFHGRSAAQSRAAWLAIARGWTAPGRELLGSGAQSWAGAQSPADQRRGVLSAARAARFGARGFSRRHCLCPGPCWGRWGIPGAREVTWKPAPDHCKMCEN